MTTKKALLTAAALALGAALTTIGCDDASTGTGNDMATVQRDLSVLPTADLSTPPGTPDMTQLPPDMGCYGTPMTHVEIINACTTATQIAKNPTIPMVNGMLPPLP